MSRLTLEQLFLANLEEKFPPSAIVVFMPKEEAYEELKLATGQDFEYDVRAWKQWLQRHPIDLRAYERAKVPEPNWKRLKNKTSQKPE